MKTDSKDFLGWKVNSPQLIKEISENNSMGILKIPLTIFSKMLSMVAERASELNDDELNGLMCRLAFYEISDPYSNEYDEELTQKTINNGNAARRLNKLLNKQ